ncbi:unnamed protein product, partial [Meganyctiphanes norvegica]
SFIMNISNQELLDKVAAYRQQYKSHDENIILPIERSQNKTSMNTSEFQYEATELIRQINKQRIENKETQTQEILEKDIKQRLHSNPQITNIISEESKDNPVNKARPSLSKTENIPDSVESITSIKDFPDWLANLAQRKEEQNESRIKADSINNQYFVETEDERPVKDSWTEMDNFEISQIKTTTTLNIQTQTSIPIEGDSTFSGNFEKERPSI